MRSHELADRNKLENIAKLHENRWCAYPCCPTYHISDIYGILIVVTTPELGTLYKVFCGSCSHPAKLELYDFPAYLASVFPTWKTVWTATLSCYEWPVTWPPGAHLIYRETISQVWSRPRWPARLSRTHPRCGSSVERTVTVFVAMYIMIAQFRFFTGASNLPPPPLLLVLSLLWIERCHFSWYSMPRRASF